MSQKSQSDGGQKHFAVGRGLLAAAETLNFNMNDQRSSRQMGGMSSGVGGVGCGMEGKDSSLQIPRHGGSTNLGSTMKLFASLGLSPSDLDALAEIPEEEISVETLPHILMQLKSRKGDAGERRAASSMSSDAGYRGSNDSWDNMGRMGGAIGQSSTRSQTSTDFGFSSLQEVSSSRGYGLNYSGVGSGGESRERQFSELPRHDSYGRLGMGAPSSDSVFVQRRMGSPSNGKVQDFLGVMPPMFPHVCALCDFDVHSTMEWNQHVNGLRHAENRRQLLDMYPEWDPGMSSVRGGGTQETPNLSAGLLGPAPMASSRSAGGASSSWGGGACPGLSGKNKLGQNKLRSRVVVVKYTRKPLSDKTLFAFAEPFGCLREHLVLSNKAFLEMDSHEEAQDMVNYYNQHPPTLYGKPISFYLSTSLMVIEKEDRQTLNMPMDRSYREPKVNDSQVVFFSNLPREEEKKRELLTIAGRFGVVEKHLFLTDQAFVQLGTPQDAEMLVKYYTINPLTIKGRPIRLNICAKYKTLNVNRRQGGDNRSPKGRRANTSSSSSGSRTSSDPKTTSFKAPSISRVKAEEKNKEVENKAKVEEKPGTEEGEDVEACEVMEGEELETSKEHKVEEPEASESVEESLEEGSGDVQEEETPNDGVDVSNDTPALVGGADGEAESQGPAEPTETESSADRLKHTEEPIGEPGESSDMEGATPADLVDQDFLENMEDFVTLDEVADDDDEDLKDSDTIDNTRKGGLRVVHILGFRRGYNFFNELLGLAKPFGEVVKHLVLDLRPEAFLQFATEEEARSMVKFYNSNVTASVCGWPVRVVHSMTYPTIQTGSSRVVYIGQLPGGKYSDEDILKLALPFGNVRKYFFNRIKKECFIEMEKADDAEKMAGVCKATPLKLSGKYLTVYVSRKYRQLKHGHRRPGTMKRDNDSTSPKLSKHPDEPPAKKFKEEKKPECTAGEEKGEEQERQSSDVNIDEKKSPEVSDQKLKISEEFQEEKQELLVEGMETLSNQNGQTEAAPPAENKPSVASLPLPPYDAQTPIGVEHVKMGYYCRVCFLFYSNEDMAKKTHCSSQAHYDKLQKYLEKEQSKVEKKKEQKDDVTI